VTGVFADGMSEQSSTTSWAAQVIFRELFRHGIESGSGPDSSSGVGDGAVPDLAVAAPPARHLPVTAEVLEMGEGL
jgi:hypothetical protein